MDWFNSDELKALAHMARREGWEIEEWIKEQERRRAQYELLLKRWQAKGAKGVRPEFKPANGIAIKSVQPEVLAVKRLMAASIKSVKQLDNLGFALHVIVNCTTSKPTRGKG